MAQGRQQVFLICAICLPVSVLTAQVDRFEGKEIVDIQYSPASTLDPADLAKVQPLKKGQALHAEDVARAIDGLFSTGRFSDIAVEGEASGNGVAVRFVTETVWFVGGVSIEGKINNPPNRGQLHTSTQFALGTPFQEEDVGKAVESLNRLLKANGLYEAQVTPEVERSNEGQQVFITFTMKSGKRAKYETPVIQGNTILSNATILRATGWRVPLIHLWLHVSDTRTHRGVIGVQNKYGAQDRLLAKVELERQDYDTATRRVSPHLTVDPGPKVNLTAVEAKVSKRILKRYVPVYQERTVDTDLLVEGKRNLEDYFQSQGYYDVDVDFRIQPPKSDVETIEYVISKGERRKVAHVAIAGNKYFDTETIRQRMFIAPASFTLRHGRYSEAFQKKDEAGIADLYKSNGFRDVQVATKVEDNYKGKKGEVSVTVTVAEGPQWLVDELDISGIEKLKQSDVTRQLASIAGQPFAEVNLASDRDTILTYYYTHGFPSAQFKASWRPGGTPQHVNVRYEITEGDRQYVRQVLTSGNHTTRQSLIDKNITLKPGDPLSPVEETNIQKKFYDLGVFASVDTAIQNADGAGDHKYVLYNFDEANRYNLSVGVGAQVARFGTPSTLSLAAPAGATGFSPQVSADLSRLNLFGVGHTVSLKTAYSTIQKLASVSYLEPRFMGSEGRNVTYTLLYNNTLDVRTFASSREEASIQLSQKFSKSLTGLFKVAYRRVSVSDVIIPVLLVPQFLQPVRIGIVSANLVQDRRNNAGNPTHGMYNTIDISLADRVFGSQRNFGRALVRNATYYKLTKTLILARQTQFGIIAPFSAPAGLSAQESVPLAERFFGGGADSLRAFPYNEAGPRDTGAPLVPGGPTSPATGFPLGGNALFFNNVELRFPLLGENIQGVFFHDMGNVFDSVSDISLRYSQKNLQDFDYTVHAAGFGVRYQTPVGPVRLDLAYSLNPPSFNGFGGTPDQLLSCGATANCPVTRQSISHFQFFFSIGQTF